MRSITLRADAAIIEGARKRAVAENTTLNHLFREWLARYAEPRRLSKMSGIWPRALVISGPVAVSHAISAMNDKFFLDTILLIYAIVRRAPQTDISGCEVRNFGTSYLYALIAYT